MGELLRGLEGVRSLLPVLSHALMKGNCGRMMVVGGSTEYTGAPYFAAISMLRLGADLVHVFTVPEAAAVIKSYSPELIVHPSIEDSISYIGRASALIIGPGLGRNISQKQLLLKLLEAAKVNSTPTVIDADGLWLLQECWTPNIKLPSPTFLTPNLKELDCLNKTILYNKSISDEDKQATAAALSREMGAHMFLKDMADIYAFNGKAEMGPCEGGCARRPGGIGDVLSGCLATFLFWARKSEDLINSGLVERQAFHAASSMVKECSYRAFKDHGRSMSAVEVIQEIKHVVKELDQASHKST